MSQKLSVSFKWKKRSLDSLTNSHYDDESDKAYIIDADVSYTKRLCNMYHKENYVVHIIILELALDYGLIHTRKSI